MDITLFRWEIKGEDARVHIRLTLWPTMVCLDFLGREYLADTDEWADVPASGVQVSLTPAFMLGSTHEWYDGPYCCYDFGFLHIVTHNWSCNKCIPRNSYE